MIRIALPYVIDAYATFDRLSFIDEKAAKLDHYIEITTAKNSLDELYVQSVYRPYLRVSLQHARALSDLLGGIIDELHNDWDWEIQTWQIMKIRTDASAFKQVLKSELATMPIYLVQPKGSHDVGVLTENGEELFPPETASKVPDTFKDMKEAGKALAYELPTSCGFHTFRVLEAVLRKYWDHVSGGKDRPAPATIGMISGQLKNGGFGEEKVWETLAQIAKLHRNPIVHPEYILTLDEAIGTIGIAYSAISAMIGAMPEPEPTTTTPQTHG